MKKLLFTASLLLALSFNANAKNDLKNEQTSSTELQKFSKEDEDCVLIRVKEVVVTVENPNQNAPELSEVTFTSTFTYYLICW